MAKTTNETRYKTAEEENAKLRETINADSASMAGKDAVIEQLKARLEAVVKECENCFMRVELFRVKMISVADMTRRHNADINDILRAARGEGGAE